MAASSLKPRPLARLLIVAACAWAIATSAAAANIWVVTDRQHPVAHAHGARVIELDAPASIEAELSSRLPADPNQAAAIVRQRLKVGGSALQKHLAVTYQGVTDAWSLEVSKIPAVVVDRHYVVYGDPDVARAVSIIEGYRRKRP